MKPSVFTLSFTLLFFIGSAQAGVIIGASHDDSLIYASEIRIDEENGTLLTDHGNRQNLTSSLGFSIASGQTRYIRIDLSGHAQFYNTPSVLLTNSDGSPSEGQLSAGGRGESWAIFEMTAGAQYTPGNILEWDVRDLRISAIGTIEARYRLYELALDAQHEGTPLAQKRGPVYTFAPALTVTSEPVTTETIDIASRSRTFVGGLSTTRLAKVEIAMSGALWTDSVAADRLDILDSGSKLVINGDFSAGLRDNNDGILSPQAVQLDARDANSISQGEAVFLLNSLTFPEGDEALIRYQTDGTRAIAAGDYRVKYQPQATASAQLKDYDLGVVATLSKNGTVRSVPLLLTPTTEGGAFRNFVRVTNNSNLTGEVVLHLSNDSGDEVSIPLEQLTGQESLEAQASTRLISVDALYQAAQAADSHFGLTGGERNKLRLSVDGAFSGLALDIISVSRDNTRFTTF